MFRDGEAKELFGITELMRDVIRTWVPLPWAPHVEVSSMQQLSTEHVSEGHDEGGRLTHRHGDVAWLVEVSGSPGTADSLAGAGDIASRTGDEDPAHGGPEPTTTAVAGAIGEPAEGGPNAVVEPLCSVLVMLEVQHEPMASMPLRMLEYVSMAMSRSFNRHRVVTPVLPVVLYTGVRPWRVPNAVRPMIRHPELVGDRYTPDMAYLLLELGTLPLPSVEHAEALNLATELVRACSSATHAELAQALKRLMMVAQSRGEERAVDAMASRLALSLARRHGQSAMGRKVDNMKALIRQTEEWLYQPGFEDLERMIEDEKQLRQEAQEKLEEMERLRETEQRLRETEQRLRETEQRLREKEQRRILRRLDVSLSRETVEAMAAAEVARRVDALLGEDP